MTDEERHKLHIELATKVMGFVYVNGTEAETGEKYSILYSGERAAEWLRLFPDAKMESEPWANVLFASRFTVDLTEANRVKAALWKTGLYCEIETRLYLSHETNSPCVMVEIKRKDWDWRLGSYSCIQPYEDSRSEALALCIAISRAINDK